MYWAYYLVIVFHVIACLFLIAVVLLQQGKGQDLASAFGGGGSQTAFGPRGSANVLSRATTILAAIFMLSSLALSVARPKALTPLERHAPAAPAGPEASPGAPAAGSPSAPAGAPSEPAVASPGAAAPAGGTATPAAVPAAPPASPAPEKKP